MAASINRTKTGQVPAWRNSPWLRKTELLVVCGPPVGALLVCLDGATYKQQLGVARKPVAVAEDHMESV